jgi:nicotinamide-nucleotide amidase
MLENPNAEIISIGTEILLGELTDTNSVHMARVLRDLGINLYYMTSVGDNEGRIADAIRLALSRAHIVITCGGLGPTVDDMTREAVALATGRGLTFHQHLLDQIAARFAGFNVQMTDNNRRQAYLPDDAIVIENPVGTAPSFIVEQGDNAVISLPGVPREMKFLLAEKVVPYLRNRYRLGIIKARVLKSAGIGESSLDDLIGADLLNSANPSIGMAAHSGQIDVRITAKAETETEADRMIAEMEARVLERVSRHIFGADDEQLEDVLVAYLREHHAKIAVVQAGIGSVVSGVLEAVSGSEEVLAPPQTYAHPDDLRQVLDLANGATLRDLSRMAAERAYEQNQVAAAISVVSLPDVDEADDSVEGTVVTVYKPDQVRDRVYGFGAKSDVARQWGQSWVLSVTWRMLKERFDGA